MGLLRRNTTRTTRHHANLVNHVDMVLMWYVINVWLRAEKNMFAVTYRSKEDAQKAMEVFNRTAEWRLLEYESGHFSFRASDIVAVQYREVKADD